MTVDMYTETYECKQLFILLVMPHCSFSWLIQQRKIR